MKAKIIIYAEPFNLRGLGEGGGDRDSFQALLIDMFV